VVENVASVLQINAIVLTNESNRKEIRQRTSYKSNIIRAIFVNGRNPSRIV
jgi:hypothetical protein